MRTLKPKKKDRLSLTLSFSFFQTEKILLAVLLVLTSAIFIGTAAHCAYPGTSAACMAKAAGLLPNVTVTHPLWLACSKIVAQIPIGTLCVRLNFFSLLCGVVSIGLLYKISSRIVLELLIDRNDLVLFRPEDEQDEIMSGSGVKHSDSTPPPLAASPFVIAHLAGFITAVSFAFCAPFWIASTALSMHSFDTLLFLMILYNALNFIYGGHVKSCIAAFFLCGIASAESGNFLLLVVVTLFFIFKTTLRIDYFSESFLLLFIVAFTLGAVLNLAVLFSLQYSENTFASANILLTLLNLAKSHVYDIQSALPKFGWPLVCLQTFLPLWITSKAISLFFTYQNEFSKWKWGIISFIMTLVCGYLLLGFPGSAWSFAREGSYLPVFPHLGIALAVGNTFTFWCLLAFCRRTNSSNELGVPTRIVRGLGISAIGAITATVLIAILLNFKDCNGKSATFADNIVKLTMDEIAGRECLITEGVIDMNFLLNKYLNKSSLYIINMPPSQSQRKTTRRTPDAAPFQLLAPHIAHAPKPNLPGFLAHWIKSNRNSADKIASLTKTQIWDETDITPIPLGMTYTAPSYLSKEDTAGLAASHSVELKKAFAILNASQPTRPSLKRIHSYIVNHLSRVTNDLGVYLEDAGDLPNARSAYEKALDINPDNLSALLNIYGIAFTSGTDSSFHSIDKLIKAKILEPGFNDSFTKNINLSGSLKQQPTEQIFLAVINNFENEKSFAAKILSFLDRWREHYQPRAVSTPESVGLTPPLVQKAPNPYLSNTVTAVLNGETSRALSLLDHYLKTSPDDFSAWMLLAEIHLNNKDFDIVQNIIIPSMEKQMTDDNAVFIDLTMGCFYKRRPRPDYALARECFLKALNSGYHLPAIYSELLDTDKIIGSARYLKEDAEKILERAPDHPQSNAVIGSYHLGFRNFTLAESHLRKSINSSPSPEAYNDLAVVYHLQEKFVEADQYARKALCDNPYFYQAWDTLSNVYLAQNKLREAEEVINCAITVSPYKVEPYLTLANIYIQHSDKQKAIELLQKIQPLLKSENSNINRAYDALYKKIAVN